MQPTARELASMAAAIARGTPKSETHLVTDDESSAAWDRLEAEHRQLLRQNPNARVEIPSDPDI